MAGNALWRAAIVTGAASGIGRSFAETLGRRGVATGLIDVSADGIAAVAETIRATGGRTETRAADVSSASEIGAAVDFLASSFGGIDLLVHCAAILGPGTFAAQPAADFDRVIQVDLIGTANVVRATLPALRQSHGAVACVASTAAVHGWPALGAYSAAKCGVAGFCDAIRAELRRDGIALTAAFPLLIDTPLLSAGNIPPILRQGRRLPPQVVVDKTLAAIVAGRGRVFIPASVRIIAALHGIAPSLLDWYGRRFGF